MLRCREISKLVSDSTERSLPWRQRMELRMHLMMCGMCAGFARQVRFLRRAARQSPDRFIDDTPGSGSHLSPEARERIKALLRDRQS